MILSVFGMHCKKRKETLLPVAWTGEVDTAGGVRETGEAGEGDG